MYLFIHDRHTERGRDIGRRRSRFPVGEADVGLDPRTLGSQPEPKADAQPLSHPGTLCQIFLTDKLANYWPLRDWPGIRWHLNVAIFTTKPMAGAKFLNQIGRRNP